MFRVAGGQGTRQSGFETKKEAIDWAVHVRHLADFEVIDDNDRVVYMEFPEVKFI